MATDRKALIREYKDTPRVMGVGIVRNSASGKSLVVASQNLPALLNRHQAQLRLGVHANRALQQDWNEGPDRFQFEILDTLSPADKPDYDPTDDLRVLEALWMEKLQPFDPAGYHPRPQPAG